MIKSYRDLNTIELPCILHSQEPLQYYCKQCKTTACKVCTSTMHTLHKTIHIDEYYEITKKTIENKSRELRKQVEILSKTFEQLNNKEDKLQNVKDQCIHDINNRTELVMTNIQQQEKNLINEVEKHYSEEQESVKKQKHDIEVLIATINSMSENIDTIEEGEPKRVLVVEKLTDVERRIANIMDSIARQTLINIDINNTVAVSDVHFTPSKKVSKLGKIGGKSLLGTSSGSGNPLSRTSRHLPTIHGRIPRSTIRAPGISSRLPSCSIIPYTTEVMVYGNTGDKLDTPRDVCVIQNQLIVADTGNDRIQVFSLKGEYVKTLCHSQLKPWAMCPTLDDNIAVADTMDRCIKIISLEGALINKFGTFLCPCGIAIDQQGKFYITDFFSSSVYVLNRQGVKIRQFDFRGQRPNAHSSGPAQISVSKHGFVVVADTSNKQLGVFTKYGNVLSTVKHGADLGIPQGVCIDKYDRVWLIDSSKHCISVYTLTGQSRGVIVNLSSPSAQGRRHGDRNVSSSPLGLTATPEGEVFITDIKQGTITKYGRK